MFLSALTGAEEATHLSPRKAVEAGSQWSGVSPETWLGLQLDPATQTRQLKPGNLNNDLRLTRQREGDQIIRRVRTRPAALSYSAWFLPFFAVPSRALRESFPLFILLPIP